MQSLFCFGPVSLRQNTIYYREEIRTQSLRRVLIILCVNFAFLFLRVLKFSLCKTI